MPGEGSMEVVPRRDVREQGRWSQAFHSGAQCQYERQEIPFKNKENTFLL